MGHTRSQAAQVPRQLKRTLAWRRQSILNNLRKEERKVQRARNKGYGDESIKLLMGPVIVHQTQLRMVEDEALLQYGIAWEHLIIEAHKELALKLTVPETLPTMIEEDEEDEDDDEDMQSSSLEVKVITGPASAGGGDAPAVAGTGATSSGAIREGDIQDPTSEVPDSGEDETSTSVETQDVTASYSPTDTSVVEVNPKAATRALTPQSQYEMVQASSLVRGTVLAPPHYAAVVGAVVIATQPSGADALTCNVAIESRANFWFYYYCDFVDCRSIVPIRLEVQRNHRPRRWQRPEGEWRRKSDT